MWLRCSPSLWHLLLADSQRGGALARIRNSHFLLPPSLSSFPFSLPFFLSFFCFFLLSPTEKNRAARRLHYRSARYAWAIMCWQCSRWRDSALLRHQTRMASSVMKKWRDYIRHRVMCQCGNVPDWCAADFIQNEQRPPLHVLHMSVGTWHSWFTCSSLANQSAHQSHLDFRVCGHPMDQTHANGTRWFSSSSILASLNSNGTIEAIPCGYYQDL